MSDETNEATEQHRVRTTFAPIVAVLRERRSELRQVPGLAVARPGYTIEGDSAVPALVLALKPGSPALAVGELGARFGVPVRSSVASPAEQIVGAVQPSFDSALLRWLEPEAVPFAAPRRGTYEPPSGPDAPRLEPIEEEMEVTVCASPDAGWPVLRYFFG